MTSPGQLTFIAAVARDLLRHRGAGAVLVGERQPAVVHAAAHALNALLGNAGPVTSYAAPVVTRADDADFGSLAALSAALRADAVSTLIVLEADLVYASPPELELERLLRRVPNSLYFGLFVNETASACRYAVPSAHVLETWLDTRALDGTTSIVQPLISPLYAGRTASEVLGRLLCDERSAHDLVKDFWRARAAAEPEAAWERALASGLIAGSAEPPLPIPELRWGFLQELVALAGRETEGIELQLKGDDRLHDGRFVNNAWLLELPCPVTKLTWSNAAWLGAGLAARLGIETGDVVALTAHGSELLAPALIVPGQAEDCVSLTIGWGQSGRESVLGANAFKLASLAAEPARVISLRNTGRRQELAITQGPMALAELEPSVLLHATLAEYRQSGAIGREQRKTQLSMYASDATKSRRQWGMVIDLNACTGCSACVIACQAENNVPTVGRDGVLKHREMHWLRIDRYLSRVVGPARVLVQPMACQHCEKAPCEYVCPTGATSHSSDGLNQMIYNRCVGTRFCSNNCPYKVRRFNWFDYHAGEHAPLELSRNPEVTVRERGVMEKCTYCVQRIRGAESRARSAGRELVDGDVRTACEEACPTVAITFGDVADSSSRVAKLRASSRAFRVLNELGAAPRTLYLAKLENPNPELA